ncbi:MAG: S1C family serine protease, partial [bacterium]|nr:S1C family serine protease [bacterium]
MSEFRGEGLGEGSNSKPLASEVSGSEHSAERFGPAYLESGASASSATPVPAPTSQPPYRSPYAPPAPSYAASSQAATGSSPYAQPGPELPPGAAPMRARTRREPRRVRRSAALAAAAGALMLGLAGGVLGSQGFLNPAEAPPTVPPDAAPTPTPTPAPADPDPAPIGAAGATVAEVAAQVLPSTVYIEVVAPQGMSSGTGMILRSDGYLVTNNHVIAAGADNPGA